MGYIYRTNDGIFRTENDFFRFLYMLRGSKWTIFKLFKR